MSEAFFAFLILPRDPLDCVWACVSWLCVRPSCQHGSAQVDQCGCQSPCETDKKTDIDFSHFLSLTGPVRDTGRQRLFVFLILPRDPLDCVSEPVCLSQKLICNSERWWNCAADFSLTKILPHVVELSGTAFRLARWMRCRNGVPPEINSCIWPSFFCRLLPETKVVAAFSKLISHI